MRIYFHHIRATRGFCARGARDWFARHDLDWNDFLANGIEVSVVEALDDEIGNQVIATVKEENDGRSQ